jgi:TPR repeat protein
MVMVQHERKMFRMHQSARRASDDDSFFDEAINIEELRKEVEAGNSEARNKLGELHWFEKYGIKRDKEEALHWWTQADKRGHVAAIICLRGICRIGSDQIARDERKAESWLRLAAQKGSSRDQVMLGDLYWARGGDDNEREARRLWEAAAEADSETATARLHERESPSSV